MVLLPSVRAVSAGAVPRALFTLPNLVLARFGACRFLLLAGYENLAAPLFTLARQCKAEVTAAAPGGSP